MDRKTTVRPAVLGEQRHNFNAVDICLPAAVTVFPGEIYQAPRSWCERAYRKLVCYHQAGRGGHVAAW